MSVRNRLDELRGRIDRLDRRDEKIELAKKVLDDRGATTWRKVRQLREWGSFAVALAAVVVALYH